MEEIKKLNARCDSLQSQITASEDEKRRIEEVHQEKAKESLLQRFDFNFEDTSASDQADDEDDFHDGTVPKFTKFESKRARYKNNMKTERFQEPRMFTMEQIRNISFACLNQSTLNDRMALQEERQVKIYKTCIKLDEIDK